MATIPEITDRLEAATEKAENASQIIYDVANGDASTEVPTASGPTPTLKKWFQNLGSSVEPMLAGIPARLDKAILSYETLEKAQTAAATLPDGQKIYSPDTDDRESIFGVESGALVFKDFAPDAIHLQSYVELQAYSGKSLAINISTNGIAGMFFCRGIVPGADTNGGTRFIDAIGRLWERPVSGFFNIEWWGATGNGSTDDTAAIQACFDYVDSVGGTVFIPDGTYRTSASIWANTGTGIYCSPRAVFQRHSSAAKNFTCFELRAAGGTRKKEFSIIDAYGGGIRTRGATNPVFFKTISNCSRGIILRSESGANSLDNVIQGIQIGLCDEAIVFENDGNFAQQGNDVRVNFVNQCKHTVVFDDLGTITAAPKWDRNSVTLNALDPFFIQGATAFLNKSTKIVPGLTYSIEDWFGGFNRGDGTMTVLSGPASDCNFTFNLAVGIDSATLMSASNRLGYDSCSIRIKNRSNLGDGAPSATAVPPGGPETFNGGVSLYRNRMRIAVPVPDLGAGQTISRVIYHALSTTSTGGRFSIKSLEGGAAQRAYAIDVVQAGAENLGMVRIYVTNRSSATVPAQTINVIIDCDG